MRDEILNEKRQRIMRRAHQIAKCWKRCRPLSSYRRLIGEAIRQSAAEWKTSVMRESLRAYFKNEYGMTEQAASREVLTMSAWQLEMSYAQMLQAPIWREAFKASEKESDESYVDGCAAEYAKHTNGQTYFGD